MPYRLPLFNVQARIDNPVIGGHWPTLAATVHGVINNGTLFRQNRGRGDDLLMPHDGADESGIGFNQMTELFAVEFFDNAKLQGNLKELQGSRDGTPLETV
jgi:hypothetical protein